MKTNTQTTQILLLRGVEDRELWVEICKIIAALKIESYKTFMQKYPLLWDLKQNLKIELDAQEEK